MPESYDAIVIGAGHNGLVAALYLARAGLEVLVLERRQVVGGAAATEEIFPGYWVNTGADDAGLFSGNIVADLELNRHDLDFTTGPVVATAPQPDGRTLTLFRDPARSAGSIAQFSQADAAAFPTYVHTLKKYARVLREILVKTPPDLAEGLSPAEILPWLRPALRMRQLGRRQMMAFLRFLPLTAREFLDEWFESPALKGLLGSTAVKGLQLGPMGSGTGFNLLYQSTGDEITGFRASKFVEGGIGNLAAALQRASQVARVEIRTAASVTRILIRDERVTGVELADGEQIQASVIVSNADPRSTLFGLVGAPRLPVRVVRQVKKIRFRGCTAKLVLGLNRPPTFTSPLEPEAFRGHIVICPSLMELERAYDRAKYGEFSDRPILDVLLPSMLDPGTAPPGKHLMTIQVQYAPYHLRNGGWENQAKSLSKLVVDTLAEYAPDLPEIIEHQKLFTPLDYEKEYGLAEGSGAHGMMALDQLFFMRPIPGYAQYQSPVKNLFLCGAGTHPGGGVTGLPGYNAAREVVKSIS